MAKRSYEELIFSTATEPTVTVLTADGGCIPAHNEVSKSHIISRRSLQLKLQSLHRIMDFPAVLVLNTSQHLITCIVVHGHV